MYVNAQPIASNEGMTTLAIGCCVVEFLSVGLLNYRCRFSRQLSQTPLMESQEPKMVF